MSIQQGANLYTQGFGSRPENVEVPVFQTRPPTTTDVNYPLGKRWIDTVDGTEYTLVNFSSALGVVTANWTLLGSEAGALNTLSDGSTTVTPTAGNIIIAGTANQVTSTGTNAPGKIALSLPSTLIAPGSIASTSTITAGTGLTVTTGGATVSAGGAAITGTTTINTSGAAVTTIGTGGTGATNIGNATGNTAVTGSLTASTTLTATLGNITATNGNLSLAAVGNKLLINASSSATCSAGTFTLSGAATTVVSNSAVTASSLIFLSTQALGTVSAASTLAVTAKSASTSFTVTPSQSTDTSTVAYLIIN